MQTLLGMTTVQLEQLAVNLGEKPFRGRQISRWVYKDHAVEIEQMVNLPKAFQRKLADNYTIGHGQIVHKDVASDKTIKYLLSMGDNERVETVWLPYAERVSVCLSTQVGCPVGCVFCATGQGGLARNMTAGEIVDQLLTAAADNPNRRISHAVFMGMGEPMLNYDAVIGAVRLMIDEMGMSARHLTISTVGVAPGIRRLAREKLPLTLAVSLHAPDDALREELIPTGRKWKLKEILDACREYFTLTGRNLTFEYLMLADINDSPEQARALAALLGDLPGNVNLIPFNFVQTAHGFHRPSNDRIREFREELEAAGRVTTQRMERGRLISAACGQLRSSRDAAEMDFDGLHDVDETAQYDAVEESE